MGRDGPAAVTSRRDTASAEPTAWSRSKRCRGVAPIQPGNAARAAAIAAIAFAAPACAYRTITSDVSDAFMLGSVLAPATHSPLM